MLQLKSEVARERGRNRASHVLNRRLASTMITKWLSICQSETKPCAARERERERRWNDQVAFESRIVRRRNANELINQPIIDYIRSQLISSNNYVDRNGKLTPQTTS